MRSCPVRRQAVCADRSGLLRVDPLTYLRWVCIPAPAPADRGSRYASPLPTPDMPSSRVDDRFRDAYLMVDPRHWTARAGTESIRTLRTATSSLRGAGWHGAPSTLSSQLPRR
jgi:hypothetical protein